ncbi:hypothetical protein IV203_027506 [Nitzschia inconspicua]|uniref:Uncharacterized protein n=1 Tax=Nitzschia inconspicua TaxID=303405 RepID=A0A9K3Q475_9STRA|nr:hypothetical protein IV203_027506 [Nitzschia inconspicua]
MNLMPSATALTTNSSIIPLVPLISEEQRKYIKLQRVVNEEKRTVHIALLQNHDRESILRLVKDFQEVASVNQLHLSTGPLRFAFFPKCLAPNMKDEWDVVIDGKPQTSLEHFNQCIKDYVKEYFASTDLADQKNYLLRTKKPYKTSCTELSSRLRYINSLMRWMPGSNGQNPLSEDDVKTIFYSMMPEQWKIVFANTGKDLTEETTTLKDLTRIFQTQEDFSKKKRSLEESSSQRGNHAKKHKGTSRRDTERNDSEFRQNSRKFNNNKHKPRRVDRDTNRKNETGKQGKDCPMHGNNCGHDWDMCIFNHASPNFNRNAIYKKKSDAHLTYADDVVSNHVKQEDRSSDSHWVEKPVGEPNNYDMYEDESE